MALPLIDVPPGGWTTDDLDALPETHHRYELTDGVLSVSPSPSSPHQIVAALLTGRLLETAPEGLAATQAVDIRFHRSLTRIPDVLVVQRAAARRHWFAPHEVLVAIELESAGSHVDDRTTKPAIYAEHRIPHYWRFEFDPFTVVTHEIGTTGRYEQTGRSTERLVTDTPWEIDIPLAELLPRWAR